MTEAIKMTTITMPKRARLPPEISLCSVPSTGTETKMQINNSDVLLKQRI